VEEQNCIVIVGILLLKVTVECEKCPQVPICLKGPSITMISLIGQL